MATRITTRIGEHKDNAADARRHNWEVMKPFVHFSVKAMMVIGSALFAIVKLIPKALEHKPEERKNDKAVKL